MRKKTPRQSLTTGEVSRLCGVAPRTVTRWCDTMNLGIRLPNSLTRRISVKELFDFLEKYQFPTQRVKELLGTQNFLTLKVNTNAKSSN